MKMTNGGLREWFSAVRSAWRKVRHSAWRLVRYTVVVLLGYLMHVCVAPYIKVGEISPHLMIAALAVITVAYGKLRAYWTGAVYGLITETMRPTLPFLNLFFYPVLSLLCGLLFSDKSEKRLEAERNLDQAAENINPYLRTIMCGAFGSLMYEFVNIAYIYLAGSDLNPVYFTHALCALIATTGATILIMYPVRRFLGIPKPQRRKTIRDRLY